MNNFWENYFNEFIKIYESRYSKVKNDILKEDISDILKSYLFYTSDSKGKLIRSFFSFRSCDIFNIPSPLKENLAISLEFFQSFTLIHDDLPALDDDDQRRGKPSLHKACGEANAILIGDALSILPFKILTDNIYSKENIYSSDFYKYYPAIIKFINNFSSFSVFSLIDGQIEDLRLLSKSNNLKNINTMNLDEKSILNIYKKKTASFFSISLAAGAILADEEEKAKELSNAGLSFGMAFQLKDDIDDLEIEKKKNNLSFTNLFGIERTYEYISKYSKEAISIIKKYDKNILLPFFKNFFHKIKKK
ncbi:MAG: polyprenyl synthetase family protein [Exilispira sp.]